MIIQRRISRGSSYDKILLIGPLIGAIGLADAAAATTDSPPENAATTWVAIPQPSSIELTDGEAWEPDGARIVILRQQLEELEREAERMSSELATVTGTKALAIVVGDEDQIEPGDLVLRTGAVPVSDSPEAYQITIDSTAQITGTTAEGVFRATRQILHNVAANGAVPAGRVAGWPAVAERALHADMARKYYSAEWVAQELRDLAYVGINTFQWHFSEHEGFRIESEQFPEVVSDEHVTKAQVRELLALAEDLHIDVVPSFVMPGHMGKILETRPDLTLQDANGNPVRGALDITDPDALEFAKALIDEYAALFPDATHWNVAADEFVDFSRMENYPALKEAAQEKFGPEANGFDLLTDFANKIGAYVQEKGYTARVWNDGMWRGNVVDLDPDIQINWWTNWHGGMRGLDVALDYGHQVMNYNDALFYYVLGENAGYKYPTAQEMWERDSHPGIFPSRRVKGKIVQQVIEQPYSDALLGASFAIWSDKAEALTQEQVSDGIRSPLRAMSERSWNAGSALTLNEFAATHEAIGRAPGINSALGAPGSVTVLTRPKNQLRNPPVVPPRSRMIIP